VDIYARQTFPNPAEWKEVVLFGKVQNLLNATTRSGKGTPPRGSPSSWGGGKHLGVAGVRRPQSEALDAAPSLHPGKRDTVSAEAVPRGLEPMDQVVIEKCRAELQSQLDELLAGAERTVVDMTSVEEENFPDPTDRASLESNRNFTLRLRDRDRKLVAKIKEAMKRIEVGTFGTCDGCGGRSRRSG